VTLEKAQEDRTGYWYGDPSQVAKAIDVLNALRAYRSSEQAMRKRTRDSMAMGETDLSALRFLLAAEKHGRKVSPSDIAKRLEISTPSVTAMLDRLERSGHVERRPDPDDGRRLIVVATVDSDSEVRSTLGEMHVAMMDVAEELSPQEAAVVERFLRRMAEAVATVSADAH